MDDVARIEGWTNLACFCAVEVAKKQHNSHKRHESGVQAATTEARRQPDRTCLGKPLPSGRPLFVKLRQHK
jgi:hypothetical protein